MRCPPEAEPETLPLPPGLCGTTVPTPIGSLHLAASPDGLVLCDFHDRRNLAAALRRLALRYPAPLLRDAAEACRQHLRHAAAELGDYFAGRNARFTTPLIQLGSDFDRRCWAYLLTIPPGHTRTYGRQAAALGLPGAARAVGRANGMNFLSVIIPCHRVIAADGELTGYGGGLSRKAWLLDHERRFAPRKSTTLTLLFDRPLIET